MPRPPEHCRHCGGALTAVDPPTAFQCDACGEDVFHNPAPNARVVVVDDDAGLLVEMADHARLADPPYEQESLWEVPGGYVEVDEQPQEGAARELREETALTVDPADLVLVDAVTRQVLPAFHSLVLFYAVARSATAGVPEGDDDASAARFWSPADLAASDAAYRELHEEPEPYRDLRGTLARARAALE